MKFQRQARAALAGQAADFRINAVSERAQNRLRVGRVARVLGLHLAAITQQPCIDVTQQCRGSQHLRQPALPGAFPQLHLEQAVLRRHKPLREKQVMLVLSVDVRHAPAIPQHPDRLREAGHTELSIDRRKCSLRSRGQ